MGDDINAPTRRGRWRASGWWRRARASPPGTPGKLFVDAGAEVVKVEPLAGDPLRRWSATGADTTDGSSPLFSHLAAGKRSVVGAVGDARVEALLAAADLVIDTGGERPGRAAAGPARPGGRVGDAVRPLGPARRSTGHRLHRAGRVRLRRRARRPRTATGAGRRSHLGMGGGAVRRGGRAGRGARRAGRHRGGGGRRVVAGGHDPVRQPLRRSDVEHHDGADGHRPARGAPQRRDTVDLPHRGRLDRVQHQRPAARRGLPAPHRARRPHRRGLRRRGDPDGEPARVRRLGARLDLPTAHRGDPRSGGRPARARPRG